MLMKQLYAFKLLKKFHEFTEILFGYIDQYLLKQIYLNVPSICIKFTDIEVLREVFVKCSFTDANKLREQINNLYI